MTEVNEIDIFKKSHLPKKKVGYKRVLIVIQ